VVDYPGLIRLHVLHHASKQAIFGLGMLIAGSPISGLTIAFDCGKAYASSRSFGTVNIITGDLQTS
jgi:hypothetical protein